MALRKAEGVPRAGLAIGVRAVDAKRFVFLLRGAAAVFCELMHHGRERADRALQCVETPLGRGALGKCHASHHFGSQAFAFFHLVGRHGTADAPKDRRGEQRADQKFGKGGKKARKPFRVCTPNADGHRACAQGVGQPKGEEKPRGKPRNRKRHRHRARKGERGEEADRHAAQRAEALGGEERKPCGRQCRNRKPEDPIFAERKHEDKGKNEKGDLEKDLALSLLAPRGAQKRFIAEEQGV